MAQTVLWSDMGLTIWLALIAAYAWSVHSLVRQGQHQLPGADIAGHCRISARTRNPDTGRSARAMTNRIGAHRVRA